MKGETRMWDMITENGFMVFAVFAVAVFFVSWVYWGMQTGFWSDMAYSASKLISAPLDWIKSRRRTRDVPRPAAGTPTQTTAMIDEQGRAVGARIDLTSKSKPRAGSNEGIKMKTN